MKNINLTLSDENYTVQERTKLSLAADTNKTLKNLVQKIEDGLYTQGAAYLQIEGLMKKPVVLTITECGNDA
jgi:hypothetical protein